MPTDDAQKPREFTLSTAKDDVVGVRVFSAVRSRSLLLPLLLFPYQVINVVFGHAQSRSSQLSNALDCFDFVPHKHKKPQLFLNVLWQVNGIGLGVIGIKWSYFLTHFGEFFF
jgi:hypothetical protein